MKANNGSGNNEERDDWETPKELWDELNEQYGFNFDCCATKSNTKCEEFADNFLDPYKFSGFFTCWMNPPFSKAMEMFEHFFRVVNKGVAIYRCDNMETGIWQEVILPNASWVFIPKGRVNYESKKGKGARFPSALIGFNVEKPKGFNGKVLFGGE